MQRKLLSLVDHRDDERARPTEEEMSEIRKDILRMMVRRGNALKLVERAVASAPTESYWRMRVYVIGVVGMAAGAGLIGFAVLRKSE